LTRHQSLFGCEKNHLRTTFSERIVCSRQETPAIGDFLLQFAEFRNAMSPRETHYFVAYTVAAQADGFAYRHRQIPLQTAE
jgi:hypothetical protein